MENFYRSCLPLKIEQITYWIKIVFGSYGEILFNSLDDEVIKFEEAIYKIGFTLFTSGEKIEDISSADKLTAQSFISLFFQHIWVLYDRPPISSFGKDLFKASSKLYRLMLINSFKDALINEYTLFQNYNLSSLEEYSVIEQPKQKAITLAPIIKGKAQTKEENPCEGDSVSILLNGQAMTSFQSCRFQGDDFFGTKFASLKKESPEKQLINTLAKQANPELSNVNETIRKYIFVSTLKYCGQPIDNLVLGESIFNMKQSYFKETDRLSVLNGLLRIIERVDIS
jgi:hypothetical protein